jgi:arginyl-tRNA synthetase
MTGVLQKIVQELFDVSIEPVFTRPDEQFGDYATNIALQLAAQLGKNPREIAEAIAGRLNESGLEASVAGPGFINIKLSDQKLFEAALTSAELPKPLDGKVIVAEYSDPNPFKALHAGHLYTSLVGDAIANLMESAGADVKRVNFGGDVGLHVGKAMWGILQALGGEKPEKLDSIAEEERAEWVSARYVEGHAASSDNETAKAEIIETNKRVYQVHAEDDQESAFAKIYWTCRKWSYDGFDRLYQRLNMKPFKQYYPESSVDQLGLETVKKHLGTVYEESDGAIIFRGEKYGLFTQVFVNGEGFTTYAGKDVGLIQQKYADYHYDQSFIITDFSQKDHLSVVLKSIEQYEPELVAKTIHHTHGRINFADGSKMSSRSGNVVMANDVLDATYKAAREQNDDVILGAIRYSFLKNRIGGDIAYDPEESVAQEGNSGPYLQYALVRAASILRKAQGIIPAQKVDELAPPERALARQLSMYPEVFGAALQDYSPHHLCNYLYELAVVFNRFYEQCRVIDDPRSEIRVQLVASYEQVLSHGLNLLGMPQPEEM